jgi:hypothetical protein
MAWLSGYSNRKKLTIDQTKIDEAMILPVLVVLTNDASVGAVANADGFDVCFTSSDGTSLLHYERESFAIASGQCNARFWVEVGTVSATTDTDFYMYYRSTDTADGANPSGTWNQGHIIFHMEDATTSTVSDSSGSGNNGAKTSANDPQVAAGKIGNGQTFDGNSSFIKVNDTAALTFATGGYGYRISLWAYLDVNNGSHLLIGKDNIDTGNREWDFFIEPGKHLVFQVIDKSTGGVRGRSYTGAEVATGAWHQYVATWTGGNTDASVKLYIDGVQVDDTNYGSGTFVAIEDTAADVYIGRIVYTADNYWFDGMIDEVRVQGGSMGFPLEMLAAFQKASYNSECNTLLTYGAEEVVSVLKTVNGLAVASVKTLRSGLAIASGKTFNGLA